MKIELIGVPGVGKTTLANYLCSRKKFLFRNDWMRIDDVFVAWYVLTRKDKSFACLERLTQFKKPEFMLRQMRLRMVNKAVSTAYAEMHGVEDHFSDCISFFFSAIIHGKGTPLEKCHTLYAIKKGVLVNRIAEKYFPGKKILLDEALDYKSVADLAAFGVPLDQIRTYCATLPPADAYVVMRLNEEQRRLQRLAKRGGSYLAKYHSEKGRAIRAGLDCLIYNMGERGVPILEIDAEGTMKENKDKLEKFFLEVRSDPASSTGSALND